MATGWDSFNTAGYLAANPDVAADPWASQNALQHYQNNGMAEGRTGGMAAFNTAGYLAANPDVAADPWASKNAQAHYYNNGQAEGRTGWGASADIKSQPYQDTNNSNQVESQPFQTARSQPSQSDNFGLAPRQSESSWLTAQPYQSEARNSNPQMPFGQNQYTEALANNLQRTSNQNLAQNVMPQISQGAQQAGQYGSSRQGIAEGVAAGNAQTGVDLARSQLYNTAYGQDQNYALGNKNADQNYALGNKSADNSFYLGNQGQTQNFYTQQRGLDQSGMALGANLYSQGNSGNLGIGAGQYQLGENYMNAPLSATQKYANMVNPYANLNGSSTTGGGSSNTSTTTTSGNSGIKSGGGLQGALGGVLGGWQMGTNFGMS